MYLLLLFFFFSSRRRHTRFDCDWSSDVCSSDLVGFSLPGLGALFALLVLLLTGLLVTNLDRKSTRLNSSHSQISYAVFCLKKKKEIACRRMLTVAAIRPPSMLRVISDPGALVML